MYIEKVVINGFLTFNNFTVNLNENLNIIVGANGVGKSNFINLINKVICNDLSLENDINTNIDNNFINISLKCNNEEVEFLNMVVHLSFICNHTRQLQNIKFDDIKDELLKVKKFDKNSIIILNYVKRHDFLRQIQYKSCCGDYIMNCSDDNCLWKMIKNIIKGKENIYNGIQNVGSINILHDIENFYVNNSNELNFRQATRLLKTINDIDCRPSELVNYLARSTYNINLLLFNFIKEKLCNSLLNTNIMADTMIENICEISKALNVNKKIDKCKNIITTEINTISEKTNIKELMHQTISSTNEFIKQKITAPLKLMSKEYELRHTMYNTQENDKHIFNEIKNTFHDITNKYFKIIPYCGNHFIDNHLFDDYNYVVSQQENGLYHNCSTGECELINFIGMYYGASDKTIFLIDELCTKLNPQYKHNLKHIFSKQHNNLYAKKNQNVIITHDVELIDPNICNNIIYFMLNSNVTKCIEFSKCTNKPVKNCKKCRKEKKSSDGMCNRCLNRKSPLDGDQIKLIFENPTVLFSKKILFVEGYTDMLFFKCILSLLNINHYEIIILHGCENKIWELLPSLNIEHKFIYDVDKITDIVRKCDCKNSFINNIDKFCGNCKLNIKEKPKIYKVGDKSLKFIKDRLKCSELDKEKLIKKYANISKENLENDVKDINKLNNQIKNLIVDIRTKDNKYFIWNGYIKDLEGIGKILFENKFKSKKDWYYRCFELKDKIESKKYNTSLNTLIRFLRK